METFVFPTKQEMGKAAAQHAVEEIEKSIAQKGHANIILATGTSQFETLKYLTEKKSIDWSKVTMFHLDEYLGLDEQHPASFRKYLKERFMNKVRYLPKAYFINGEAENPVVECERLSNIITARSIDLALIGIGENGHLAFNDPPADFATTEPFIIVDLDEQCRRQQLNEGWFNNLNEVPSRAISMSIRQIMKSTNIIVSVPERRKATAVKKALEGEVSNLCPASILQQHGNCQIFMDNEAASLLV